MVGDSIGQGVGAPGLHLFNGFDAEDFEALAEDFRGEVAEDEAAGAFGGFGLEHGAVLIEPREMTGEFVEVIAEEIRAIFFGGEFEDDAEIEQVFREGEFGGLVERNFCIRALGAGDAAFAEDAADARVRVLQVRRGVAVQREHLVPTEHVIALAVGEQVGVFDRAEADNARDLPALRLGQFGVLLGNDLERAFLGFVEQVGEFDGVARARLERLAILPKDRTEPDVREFDFRFGMPAAERGENLLEM